MLSQEKILELKVFSKQIQMQTAKTIASLGVGHIGGSLSLTDLLAVLYGAESRTSAPLRRVYRSHPSCRKPCVG